MKVKTAVCTGCEEELALLPYNFHRNKTTRTGYAARCKAGTEFMRIENDAVIRRFERLPPIKVKAARILSACGFDDEFIAKDMKSTTAAVANSLAAEREERRTVRAA
jgi:hypothetical protein